MTTAEQPQPSHAQAACLPTKLYHVHPTPLARGSIILAGNFGRILKLYSMGNVNTLYHREHVLEDVRASHFPSKPSRLTSSFVLDSLAEAQAYRQAYAASNVISEVELVDTQCNRHRGDYKKVGPPNNAAANLLQQVAQDYWNGMNIQNPEIVAATDLRIVRLIP